MTTWRATLRTGAWKRAIAALIFLTLVGGYALVARGPLRAPPDRLPAAGRPTGPCTLWFVGSSTVARWSGLAGDMAPWDAHGRGVNGALIPDIAERFDRDEGRAPAAIVFYAGENDIAAGATGAEAAAAFEAFMTVKRRRYGALPVIALTLKPSPARWGNLPQQMVFNTRLRRLADRRGDLSVIDIRPLMLVNRRPGPFYVADRLHMNREGYARWTQVLRAFLVRSPVAPCAAGTFR